MFKLNAEHPQHPRFHHRQSLSHCLHRHPVSAAARSILLIACRRSHAGRSLAGRESWPSARRHEGIRPDGFGKPLEFSGDSGSRAWQVLGQAGKSGQAGQAEVGSAGKERVAWTSVRMASIDPSEPSSGVAGTPPQG